MVHRPTAEYVLQNPYFWDSAKRLTFLCDSSDRFEIMERDPPTLALEQLEDSTGFNLYISPAQRQEPLDWYKKVDRVLLDNLGKYRRYDSNSVRDLLRVMRNKVSFEKNNHSSSKFHERVSGKETDDIFFFVFFFLKKNRNITFKTYRTVSNVRWDRFQRGSWDISQDDFHHCCRMSI